MALFNFLILSNVAATESVILGGTYVTPFSSHLVRRRFSIFKKVGGYCPKVRLKSAAWASEMDQDLSFVINDPSSSKISERGLELMLSLQVPYRVVGQPGAIRKVSKTDAGLKFVGWSA
jgi:hypothetical protein